MSFLIELVALLRKHSKDTEVGFEAEFLADFVDDTLRGLEHLKEHGDLR